METADTAAWTAVVGRNADHYLKHFQRMAVSGRRWLPGWNSAAFLHSTAWFWYRRMYGWALLNFVAPWLLIAVLIAGSAWIAPRANLDSPALVLLTAYLACVFVLVPLFADSLYYRHVVARLPRAKPPSFWTGLGAASIVLLWMILLLAALLPAYGDYGATRAKVHEAFVVSSSLRIQVTEFHGQHGRLPSAAEAARLSQPVTSKYVQSLVYDAEQRSIVVTMSQPLPGKRFAIRAIEQGGQLSWKCGTIDLDKKHLPLACRD